jgi:hypothetical protein
MADVSKGSAGLSTVPIQPAGSRALVERRLKITSTTLIIVVVGLGVTGLLGVRTGVASATGGRYRLEVLHTEAARPGLATPLDVTVSTRDGSALPEELTIRLASSYLDSLDVQTVDPAPTRSFGSGQSVWWWFAVPSGESVLRVHLDARLEPDVQWARPGVAGLLIEGGDRLEVDFTTWVFP